MNMDPSQQLHQNFLHPDFNKQKTTISLINTPCHLPDSTTESPTANPMESLLLQNVPNTLPQLTTCNTNQLMQAEKQDNALDTFKTLDDNEVADLISGVSDVMVDSTQPPQTLLDLPQFVDNGVSNYPYIDHQQVTHVQSNNSHITNTHYNIHLNQNDNVTQPGVQLSQNVTQHGVHLSQNVRHPSVQLSQNVTQHGVQHSHSNITQHGVQHSHSNVTQHGAQLNQNNVTQHGVQHSHSNVTQHGVQHSHSNVTQHGAQLNQNNVTQHGAQLRQSNVTQHGAQLNQNNVTQHGAQLRQSSITQHGAQLNQSNVTQPDVQFTPNDVTQPNVQFTPNNVTQHGVQLNQNNVTQHGVQLRQSNVTQHGAQLNQSNVTQPDVQLNRSNITQPDVQLSQNNVTQQNVQLNQSNVSLIIQPELNKSEEKVPQNLVCNIDQCISRIQPNFSNYPSYCKCQVVDKVVAVEQIWVCNEQMYFLPHICVLAIANQEYTGIFYDGGKCFIALGEVIEKMMPQYESDLIKFLQRCENVEQQTLTPQEIGYLQQRKCISENCIYNTAITLSMLRQMAQYIMMYEGHKPAFDPRIKKIANESYYRKILQRQVRCAACGGFILFSQEPDEFVVMNTETNLSNEESKCFSVGFINAGGEKFVAFKSDGRVYVSLKELCFKKIFKLQGLQARLQTLRQRPRLAPSLLNNYLNTPQYNVSNTMWIDISTLRCVCCMGKCLPGYNAEVYNCFSRVNFTENIVTNIYGQDDYQNDKAVYTMDPKTFEVIMKKMPMKSKFKPENMASKTKKKHIKSFELSSKEMSGYESPEKLNDSAFLFEKQEDDSLEEHYSSLEFENQAKKRKNVKNQELCAPDHSKAVVSSIENDKTTSSIWQNANKSNNSKKHINGDKSPTFRVKPAERPYKYTENIKENKSRSKKPDTNKQNSTLNNKTSNDRAKKCSKSRKPSGKTSQACRKKNDQELENTLETSSESVNKRPVENVNNGQLNTSVNYRDETSNAVNHLVEEFGTGGDYDLPATDTITACTSNEAITPRTENRILSRIDLNGSINDIFETPTQRNVVVEMMDTNISNAFDYSSSELTRLYDQYERFEKSVTPDRTSEKSTAADTETSLHRRNEIDMPIDTSLIRTEKPGSRINDENQNIKNQYLHVLDSQISNPIPESPRKNTELKQPKNSQREVSNVNNSESIVGKELSPGILSSESSIGHGIEGKPSSLEGRNRNLKTLSPAKNTGSVLSSPMSTPSIRSDCTNSPVFKKSGEIDRSHAKVKKLTDMVHQSQPLDFLASIAEVITGESMNDTQSTEDRHDEQTEMCAVSDENLNVEKVHICTNIEDVVRSESNLSDVRKQMCKLLQEVEEQVNINPYKDSKTGHWKVKIKLKPGAKEALPGLFGDGVDPKKRNQFLAILGKLHIPSSSKNSKHLKTKKNNSRKNNIQLSSGKTALKQSNNKKKLKSSSNKNCRKPMLKPSLDCSLSKKSSQGSMQKEKSSKKRPLESSQEGKQKKKKRCH